MRRVSTRGLPGQLGSYLCRSHGSEAPSAGSTDPHSPGPPQLTRGFPSLSGPQEFEIELEGSQTLRILCYEKCYNRSKITKEDGESADRIMGKGQVQVRLPPSAPCRVLSAPRPTAM